MRDFRDEKRERGRERERKDGIVNANGEDSMDGSEGSTDVVERVSQDTAPSPSPSSPCRTAARQ
jgi:hypothetical protein